MDDERTGRPDRRHQGPTRTTAIIEHWRLDDGSSSRALARAAEAQQWGVVVDSLLAEVATHPESPQPYFALIEYALLRGNRGGASLLFRTMERRTILAPDWTTPVEYSTLEWLLGHLDRERLGEYSGGLLVGPAPLRRAFLPSVLEELPPAQALALSDAWLERFPDEPEAWWAALALATVHGDARRLERLTRLEPRFPRTAWQWHLAFRTAPSLPEPLRWSYVAELLDQVRKGTRSSDVAASIVADLVGAYREQGEPVLLLLASLVSSALGQSLEEAREIQRMPEPVSSFARALTAALAVLFLRPNELTPWLRRALSDLLASFRTGEEPARTIVRLIPALDVPSVVEFALLCDDDEMATRARELIQERHRILEELIDLAQRVARNGKPEQSIFVLRLVARRARERNDRPSLLRALRLLAELDPSDERTLEFVVTTDIRSGQHGRALATLLTAADRAATLGTRARQLALLERAATLAELLDDRDRLAAIADALAANDPENPDRHIFAATAALRAGRPERAKAYLWTAIRTALRQRRLTDALSAAEQLAALDPTDEAAAVQLAELRVLLERRQHRGSQQR